MEVVVCGKVSELEGGIFQVLINLVGNACKFTHEGYITVDVSIVCDKCHQGLNTGERQCSQCISSLTSEMALNGLGSSGDLTGKDQHALSQNGSYREPESPEAVYVPKAASSSQRRPFRAVENIRAQMTLCETYNGLAIDKVSSAATNNIHLESKYGVNHQLIEVQYDPIAKDSQLKPPYFANSNKRKRECHERLEGENGDMSTEADQMLTQNSFDGDHTMERKETSYSAKDEFATTYVDDHADDDDEMIMERPRMVRWFKFCVIDTGIG